MTFLVLWKVAQAIGIQGGEESREDLLYIETAVVRSSGIGTVVISHTVQTQQVTHMCFAKVKRGHSSRAFVSRHETIATFVFSQGTFELSFVLSVVG